MQFAYKSPISRLVIGYDVVRVSYDGIGIIGLAEDADKEDDSNSHEFRCYTSDTPFALNDAYLEANYSWLYSANTVRTPSIPYGCDPAAVTLTPLVYPSSSPETRYRKAKWNSPFTSLFRPWRAHKKGRTAKWNETNENGNRVTFATFLLYIPL